MLGGMQLDRFTPLKAGPMSSDQLAAAIRVSPTRIRTSLCYRCGGNLMERAELA